jgi:hypothetical protein
MIRNSLALAAALEQGRTIARMADFDDPRHFRWVMVDTNEPVHGTAVKTLVKREKVRTISIDMCGAPMQLGAV